MISFLLKLNIVFFIITSVCFASSKDTNIIVDISAKPLYELDFEDLDRALNQYLKDKTNIHSMQITDLSYNEIYWKYALKKEKFICSEPLIKESKYIFYKSKKIGRVDVCYNNLIQIMPTNLAYTKKENQWIKRKPIIKIAKMDYWPVDIYEKNIHIDYINLLSKYGALNISLVDFSNWSEGLQEASKGEKADGILNLSWSKDREKNMFNYSKAYYYTPLYIIVKKENNSVKNIEDLEHKSVILKQNSITNQLVEQIDLDINATILDDNLKMLQLLAKKDSKKDAVITYVLDKDLLDKYNLKVAKEFYNKHGEVHIGVSKKYPELKSILEKAHNKIPKDELNFIQNKIYKYKKNKMMKLSSNELNWLLENRDITFAGNPNWMPFEVFSKDGSYVGFVSEYLKLIEKNINFNIEKIKTKSWHETQELAKKSEVDIISGDINDKILNNYYNPIKPYINSEVVIVKDENVNFIEIIFIATS